MPVSDQVVNQITQLQAQQAAITNALKAMLEGTWTGAGSVEAYLLALDPTFQLTPKPPDYTAPRRQPAFTWNPETFQPQQSQDWTCSACALAWVLRATGAKPDATEASEVEEIGQPGNINPTYGLMDASGPALRKVYAAHGFSTSQGWLTFDQLWALAGKTTGQMSGGEWYHWVAIRGREGASIRIANSARGYKGVFDTLSREDFARLGPFSVVWLNP